MRRLCNQITQVSLQPYRNSEYTGKNPTVSFGWLLVLATWNGYFGTLTSGPGRAHQPLVRMSGSRIASNLGSGIDACFSFPSRPKTRMRAGLFLNIRLTWVEECLHRSCWLKISLPSLPSELSTKIFERRSIWWHCIVQLGFQWVRISAWAWCNGAIGGVRRLLLCAQMFEMWHLAHFFFCRVLSTGP